MTDAEALDWLDRLLVADEAGRETALLQLAGSNPQLHARLRRMLASALSPEQSQVLVAPVLEGCARIADASRALSPGDVLAGYRMIRELGRGGMSVVWLAERADGVVKRHVAFKMPMFMLQGAADVERFARERDALASLSHPHVARLFDAGVMDSGQPFIVLELVEGEPLTVFCDARRFDLRARVRLFLQVLSAVEHAHKHLIVHRDLKPSNILVDGESRVRLLDFGIAKLLGDVDAAALTQQGGAMTPLYAAPEQIRGETISTLTDVYSLGMLLHELVTGVLPYKVVRARATVVDIHEALTRGELPRASQAGIDDAAALARAQASTTRLRGELGGDLDTIVSKALRISPQDRYASAAHMADDLRRWLDHQPIAARRPSFWYSTGLALRRHRLAAGVAGVGAVLVAGAGVVAWLQHLESRAHEERTAAVRDFMFELVSDAEASDGQQGDVTGRQMVEGAVERARRDFADQPQLRGELLVELGRMFVRLGADEDAVPVLREGVATLERVAPAQDPALNKGRVYLAGVLMDDGEDLAHVGLLARTAREACATDEVDCVKARAYAGNLLSQIASFAGDDELALEEMRRSAVDTEQAFGATHNETVVAFMSLAVTARNAGHLREAGDAMARAMTIASAVRMRAADRAQLDRTMAIIDYDLGRYEAARDRLRSLIATTADAGERALQLRFLANVYAELGDGPQTLKVANEGLASLPADSTQEAPFLRQALARGLGLSGRADEALATIEAVIAALGNIGRAADSFEVLRARRYRAEFLALRGRDDEVLAELRSLRDAHAAVNLSPVERGLVLDLLGEAERRNGDVAAARESHARAREALGEQLPEGHPFMVRNTALGAGVAAALNRVVRQ